jgi:hypothetical protein
VTHIDLAWVVVGVGLAATLTAALLGARYVATDFEERAFCLFLAAVLAAVTLWWAWPLDMQYHQFRLTEGTVVAVSSPRILGSSDGGQVSQVYAVDIAGVGVRRCDDTRCALLQPGDWLSLWCERDYQWASTPGWVCRFGELRPAGQ